MDLLRTLHLEALALAFVLCLALLAALSLYAAVARRILGNRRPWLWPVPEAAPRYAGLAALLLATGVLVAWAGPGRPGSILALGLAAVGATAVALGAGTGRRARVIGVALVAFPLLGAALAEARSPSGLDARSAASFLVLLLAGTALAMRAGGPAASWSQLAARRAYVAWAAAALAAFAAAPAYAFFRAAWQDTFTRYVGHAQAELARRLDAHPRAVIPGAAAVGEVRRQDRRHVGA
jgi:hypothetical protein